MLATSYSTKIAKSGWYVIRFFFYFYWFLNYFLYICKTKTEKL